MDRRLQPRELKELLQTTQEYAVLDVREEGAFSETHLLAASNLPLSRLEFRAPSLVPNFGARIVLMDEGGEGLAEEAFERLTGLGYRSLQILAGGVRAWEAEGYSVYSGVNVLSKAFGEVVYERCGTPDITAETLKAWVDAGKDMVILDSRPFSEYHEHTIPGSISMPGAELAFRVHELAADPDTAIVVNCAGRTRSIIGCQSLRNAGLPNDVYCLRNGTMGWKLAGFGLETQQTRSVGTISPAGRARAQDCQQHVVQTFGVRFADADAVEAWAGDPGRTVYLLDVRTPEAFEAGHLPFASNAPGGQLVQATDEYVAVHNATLVLIDPDTVRAAMTASWLMQLGWKNVFVLEGTREPSLAGADRPAADWRPPDGPTLTAADLQARLASPGKVLVFDVATSVKHRQGHVPGAAWGVRGRYELLKPDLDRFEEVVVTGDDPRLVALTADDLRRETDKPVFMLADGNAGWVEAGYPLQEGLETRYSDCDDVWYKPFEYDDPDREREAANAYLKWEVELVEKIERDGVSFALATAAKG